MSGPDDAAHPGRNGTSTAPNFHTWLTIIGDNWREQRRASCLRLKRPTRKKFGVSVSRSSTAEPRPSGRAARPSPAMFDRCWKASRAPRYCGRSRSFRSNQRSKPTRCGPRPVFAPSRKTSTEKQDRPASPGFAHQSTNPNLNWAAQSRVRMIACHRRTARSPRPKRDPEKQTLGLEPRVKTGFPRDKREASARRSCLNQKVTLKSDSAQLNLDGTRVQQRLANKVRGVSRPELSHGLGAMAFEGPWADPHPQGALFIGAPFADEVQDLALALRQRLLAGVRCKHDARRANTIPGLAGSRLINSLAAWHSSGAVVIFCELLHHGADALGLLKRIFHHLLQVIPFTRRLRKLMAVLLDLTHVEQQRRQRPVELTRNRSPGLIHRQCARS